MAYVVAGHHAGLADSVKLTERLIKDVEPWQAFAASELLTPPLLESPPLTLSHGDGKRGAFQLALFTRMLFSCLVDADRLATESFCDGQRAALRTTVPIASLKPLLDEFLYKLSNKAGPSFVQSQRQQVLQACRCASSLPPGLFSLSVPTGGGKTLSSLAFALDHAKQFDKRRVIVAIPYTSIIEQTADQYRQVFQSLGESALVEHHTNVDPHKETRQNRLAVENWDSPLVVTTNVQLLESLMASRTSPCRKLHRVAGSVIILDEAQTLPVGLLKPCLALLRELVADYSCSVVLCTATQPALDHREGFDIGLTGVREIMPEPQKLAAAMKRVEVERCGTLSDEQLVARLASEPSWLTIVNTRGYAADLFNSLHTSAGEDDGLFHLSTNMCAQHRSDCIQQIRSRLQMGQPCRVVSTQLIEAGVDLSFPVVYRAMAGLDSIAQAAGRCNRHGELPSLGRVYVFDPERPQPRGLLAATAATASEVAIDYDDLLDPEAVRRYFELHYWNHGQGQPIESRWDDKRVMECFPEERGQLAYDFREADQRFQLIEDNTTTLFVPHAEGKGLIEQMRQESPSRFLLRQLQRYTVGVREHVYAALEQAGDIELLESGYSILTNESLYSSRLGLRVDRPGYRDPEATIA
ncbi:DEAD/DEAH box helicase [Aeoliella mucimassa]|uniref:DEAD/DEAH box helicase n=1 Tax=Aeoliella mucimassa TaxID=2527972 RepID=A0A518AQM4_9BACT|nr:DEAD/DEAH box helicase [Aeoliella mucimassa]